MWDTAGTDGTDAETLSDTIDDVSTEPSEARPTSRWRTSRPPASWDGSVEPSSCIVELPLRLYWSDGHNRFDLADISERRLLYQIVLAEGTPDDVCEFLHPRTLLEIWDELWLSAAVHEAWDGWVEARRHAVV